MKTTRYDLTEDEISDIADRELGNEGFWQDGEIGTINEALKNLTWLVEYGRLSRITFDYYFWQHDTKYSKGD